MIEYEIEQAEHLLQDILQVYLQFGCNDECYDRIADLLDLAATNAQASDEGLAAMVGIFNRLMDVLYKIDTQRLSNWTDFLTAMNDHPWGEMLLRQIMQRDHRRPPKPRYYYIVPKGYCRLCGKGILTNGVIEKRRQWHPECLDNFKSIYWPRQTRDLVWKRDRGQCAVCGETDLRWQVDHKQPLIESRGDIAYWTLANLQTLCQRHHAEKTSRENSERHKRKPATAK